MIDNFDKIRKLLKFPSKNSFYFLEIIKRRKENPEMERHAKLIKDFYIYSLQEFDELRGKVTELCEENNARAYFRLNLRDSKRIAHQYLKRIAELLITEDYKAIPNSYASVVGEFHLDPDRTWVVDIDFQIAGKRDFEALLSDIKLAIDSAYSGKENFARVALLPTKNGFHIITRPFRLDVFKEKFPEIDVHKDNPTILYCP